MNPYQIPSPSPSSIKYISSLDRINQINSKLNSIQNSISKPYVSPESPQISNHINERLSSLEQQNFESQEIIFKEFSELKRDISNLLHQIEEEHQNYVKYFSQKKYFLENLEKKLLNQIAQEQNELNDMEERLISQIDKNTNILRTQLIKENKNKENDLKIFGNFLENEMPKIIKDMKDEAEERHDSDINLSKLIDDGFTKLYSIINEEKLNRENTENSLVEMVKGIISRMKVEIENEKSIRDANEKNLINILEQTIQKLNFPS